MVGRVKTSQTAMTRKNNFFRTFASGAICLYQQTLSFDHSWLKFLYPYGFCRFYPSCSEYAKQAIVNRGVFKGIAMGVLRLGRCHPWNSPRVDLAPKQK